MAKPASPPEPPETRQDRPPAAPPAKGSRRAERPPASSRPVRALVATAVALLGLYALALAVLRPPSPGREISLDELLAANSQRQVASARFLDEDARVVGTLRASAGAKPVKYWASYPRSDAATNDLLKTFLSNRAEVTVDPQTSKAMVRFLAQFLLPLLILANLFALLFLLARGRGSDGGGVSEYLSFGRLADKRLGSSERPNVTFADVAGADEVVAELAEIRDYLADPSAFKRMGAQPPKGVLLVGPPGCGKTLLARAVAGEAKASFFSISGSEFVESLVGVGAARVRHLFEQAAASAPSIVFIDELDGAGRQRGAGLGGGHDEREQTLNELLVQMDGFSPASGIVVLGATNRPDILDPALVRAGRFDRRVTVERPSLDQRLAILRLHAGTLRIQYPEADLPFVAKRTAGFTGADLANVLNEAALLAVRQQADSVGHHHLEEAIERVVGGPRRATRILSLEDKRQVAYHEAGHAVAAAAVGKAEELDKVTILGRGGGLGHVAVAGEDKAVVRRRDIEDELTIAMAGVAAEELVLGEPSTGAEADLERANRRARDMVGRYGMSPGLGRVHVLREQGEAFLGRDYMLNAEVSQPTLEHIDAEVRRILDEREEAARAILTTNRTVLDSLAGALVRDETLQGAELQALLAEAHRPSVPDSNGGRPVRDRTRR